MIDKNTLNQPSAHLIYYPLLGANDASSMKYEYNISWKLRDVKNIIQVPAGDKNWLSTDQSMVSLYLPFTTGYIEAEIDREKLLQSKIDSVNIKIASPLAGEKQIKSYTHRAGDPDSIFKTKVLFDRDSNPEFQATWYRNDNGRVLTEFKKIQRSYIFMTPPSPDKFIK